MLKSQHDYQPQKPSISWALIGLGGAIHSDLRSGNGLTIKPINTRKVMQHPMDCACCCCFESSKTASTIV